MSSTHSSLICHAVFSTKDRVPLIQEHHEPELFSYMGGILKSLEVHPIIINGVSDHVHCLIGLKPTHTTSEIIRDLKKGSSIFLHDQLKVNFFCWQVGYGLFSVSRSQLDPVYNYIQGQKQHHFKMSFQEEYLLLLKKHQIAFDEKYLW